jgi:tryptophan synthase alpha subunit
MLLKQSAVLGSVVAGATISTQEMGFLPGMKVAAVIGSPAGAIVGSAIVQTSEDGTTWGTATGASAVTTAGLNIQEITLKQFLRFNMTAWTSGNLQATFLSGLD